MVWCVYRRKVTIMMDFGYVQREMEKIVGRNFPIIIVFH